MEVTVITQKSWEETIERIRQKGIHMAEEIRAQGHDFKVSILAPRQVLSEDTIPLKAVRFDLDWKTSMRLEMIELARDLITKSYLLGALDASTLTVLGAIIEGSGLFEQSIGEFFLLYGKFEQKHRSNGRKTRAKMMDLVNEDRRYLKPYKEHGKERLDPLPYAVRNILSHIGRNPNTLDQNGNDLRTSIELLKSWVAPREEVGSG